LVDLNEQNFASAQSRIRSVLDDAESTSQDLVDAALTFAADAFDRSGQFEQAFELYTELNERRRQLGMPLAELGRMADDMPRLQSDFEGTGYWNASPPAWRPRHAPAQHVFVLGFMRSGTTLLTAALAQHRDVVAIDERELLSEQARMFLGEDSGFQRLSVLGRDEIAHRQDAYWNTVHAAGFRVSGKVFVDKMPFNSISLPIIARIFPDAKIIFAFRDPRDVVFSCFRRRFDLTPYSFEFLRLDDCARFYAAVMTLAEKYRERLRLNLMEVRYEDVTANFEHTMRRLCDFIGLDWQDSLRGYGASSAAIDPRSASASQVRRELFGDAVGAWRSYRSEFVPVIHHLQPWIAKLGYPAD